MLIIKLLFWLALLGAAIGGLVVAARMLRGMHTLFRPVWFLVPLCLALPLFTLLDKPQFGSPLWRALLAFCVAMCMWALSVGVIEGARRLYLWMAGRNLMGAQGSGHPGDAAFGAPTGDTILRWEDALQIVLMLDAHRWDAGLPPEWLDGQCASFPLLAEALIDLRRRGLIKSGSRPSSGGSANIGGLSPEAGPYEILGVSKGASHEAVRKAYREQMKRYHPDRLQQFGPEFTRLAEEKAKSIQRAYEELIGDS